jgi:ParB family transcriptional regulator, chromosome partitioning protein
VAKAVTAANRTFAARPASLLEQKRGSDADALDGRRRLAGAYFIEIGRIHPDPSQPRRQLDPQAQQELTQSVKQFGIMQPITVRYIDAQKIYQIISGERRYQAALAAKLAEIPCWVQSPREEEILLRQIVENWQRSDLSPFELADALAAIRDANKYSQDQLAKVTGKPKGEISKLLALLSLAPEAQQQARQDHMLSRRQLYAVSQLPQPRQVELIKQIQQQGLKVTETEELVRREKRPAHRRGSPTAIRRFQTSSAIVTVSFRKRSVADSDVLAALIEAQDQLASPSNQQELQLDAGS